jgi:hypothetical protein
MADLLSDTLRSAIAQASRADVDDQDRDAAKALARVTMMWLRVTLRRRHGALSSAMLEPLWPEGENAQVLIAETWLAVRCPCDGWLRDRVEGSRWLLHGLSSSALAQVLFARPSAAVWNALSIASLREPLTRRVTPAAFGRWYPEAVAALHEALEADETFVNREALQEWLVALHEDAAVARA